MLSLGKVNFISLVLCIELWQRHKDLFYLLFYFGGMDLKLGRYSR